MIMNRLKYVGLGLVASFLICGGAMAATSTITATMTFDSALSLTPVTQINFGVVKALTDGTYVMDTDGNVTPGGNGVLISGTPVAGEITITGSTTQTVAISTGNYVADSGVTLSEATCNYNGGAIADCDAGGTGLAAPGAGKTLKLGVTATADDQEAAGTVAHPTFDVTVIYG